MLTAYIEAFERGLDDLRQEIEAYEDEARIWAVSGEITNSGGNLALHLVGNLQHFIGAELGATGYRRDRAAEFAARSVSRAELVSRIVEARGLVRTVLSRVPERDLEMEVKAPALGAPQRLDRWLLHLVAHLAYHLGQINYHRRLVHD